MPIKALLTLALLSAMSCNAATPKPATPAPSKPEAQIPENLLSAYYKTNSGLLEAQNDVKATIQYKKLEAFGNQMTAVMQAIAATPACSGKVIVIGDDKAPHCVKPSKPAEKSKK
jgi:hypothetical protein